MARLNDMEKLIERAAKKLTPFEAKVYDKLLAFYRDSDFLHGSNDAQIINELYATDHGDAPFELLAQELGTSVSRLEDRRREYQKMFWYYYEQLKQAEAA